MFDRNVITRLESVELDVEGLKRHRTECDVMHEQHKEHRKRHDDAMNNLTESNMMLAKSITSMDVTLNKLVSIVESDQPDIKIIKNARIAWDVNKTIFFGVVAIATGISAILAVYHFFF